MNADYLGSNCWQCLLVLTVGTGVCVGLAAAAARAVRRGAWQRTFWQVAVAALLVLLAMEWTGLSRALWRLAGPSGEQPSRFCCGGGNDVGWDKRSAGPPSRAFATDAAELSVGRRSLRELVPPDGSPQREQGTQSLSGNGDRTNATPGDKSNTPRGESPGLVQRSPPGRTEARAVSSLASRTNQEPWGATGSLHDRAPPALADKPPVAAVPLSATAPGLWAAAANAAGKCAPWLAWLWAAGTGFCLVRLAWVHLLLGRFRRRQIPVCSAELQRCVERLSQRLGLGRRVALVEAPELASPVTLGILRPTVMLPAEFCRSFEPCAQEAILAHELAHLAGLDPVWSLLADLAAAQLWWNPLVWWARRRLQVASEAAADEASVLVPGGPDALAASLVAMGRRLASPGLAWLSVDGAAFRSGLGRRVQRLVSLSLQARQFPSRRRLALGGCVIVTVLVVASTWCTAWAVPQANIPRGGTTMNVLASSWRQSLAAAVLAAVLAPSPVSAGEGERPKEPPEKPAVKEEARPVASAPAFREMMEKRRHLEEQAMEIRRKLGSLKPDQDADARELKEKLQQIGAQLREMRPGARPGPDREAIARRMAELKEAFLKAREAENREEMERIEREVRELRQAMGGRDPRGGPEGRPEGRREGRPEGPPEAREGMERAQHLRAAIENLHAAGMHDAAERLAQELRGRAPGREGPPRPEGREDPGRRERPEGRDVAPERLMRVIQEMRGQMEEMRQQVQQLREAVEQLKAKPERR